MDYDVIVIGAGPGGYTAAIRASQLGLKVAVVEYDTLGGTCLNRGCIPTKVLLQAAHAHEDFARYKSFGFTLDHSFDVEKLKKYKEKTVRKLVLGINYLFKKNNITLLEGKAAFLDNNTIDVRGKELKAKYFIIATGSKPVDLPITGANLPFVINSDRALRLENISKNIVIIGGGVIGLEFAFIYNALGAKVTIIELMDKCLPMLDDDIVDILLKKLKSKNIDLNLGARVEEINNNGSIRFSYKNELNELYCDQVLSAVGREPKLDGLSKLNLKMNKNSIKTDEYSRTSIDNIYAIGDVVGNYQLAHVASHEGIVAAQNIAGQNIKKDLRAVPVCIYTIPEIAWVGISSTEAKNRYDNIRSGSFPYMILSKAAVENEKEGLIKIVASGENKEILGVQIIGRSATELIHEAVLAVAQECTVDELANIIHAHPTLSEGIREASDDLLGIPINKI